LGRWLRGKIISVKTLTRISLAMKALRELGPRQLSLYSLYKLGIALRIYNQRTPKSGIHGIQSKLTPLLILPDPTDLLALISAEALSHLVTEADEIVRGKVRLFGGDPQTLSLAPPGTLHHWTAYEKGDPALAGWDDIKLLWEPARFGWAFTLGRAYMLMGTEAYPAAFWRYLDFFLDANPVNMGPNWASAQEVAFRIMAFTFAAQVFAQSPQTTAERQARITRAVAEHAARIPATLVYARAQNNNHLLSEALGLITASLALPEHPDAGRWGVLGWKWFNRGLESQIEDDGTYSQHSTNYHRLMLVLALWGTRMQHAASDLKYARLSGKALRKLNPAVKWLLALCDPDTGQVPNLGPNDGANVLPLTILPYNDYRPVLQAAARDFLGAPVFEPGPWDEMSLWLGSGDDLEPITQTYNGIRATGSDWASTNTVIKMANSWGYLRAAHFSGRPGHADQLHLDLWWHGLNVAQDAGTYLYNACLPWDNALTNTVVHNTLMIESLEQMTWAGRFLYLDRAQAEILGRERASDGSWECISARHDGYLKVGLIHSRRVTAHQDDRWVVEDWVQPVVDDVMTSLHEVRLHWLLPDWPWEIEKREDFSLRLNLKSPHGWLDLNIIPQTKNQSLIINHQLVRCGELLHGTGSASPILGWVSPTYALKHPALSFAILLAAKPPLKFVSEWHFPKVC
jgi:hypothetical protein